MLKRFLLRHDSQSNKVIQEVAFTLIALTAGMFFFASLGRLWPMADVPLNRKTEDLVPNGIAFLETRGFDLDGYLAESRLRAQESALEYLEQHLDHEALDALVQQPLPLLYYEVMFKKPGSPITYVLSVHPNGRVLGWSKRVLEEAEGAVLDADEARALAECEAAAALGLVMLDWRPVGVQTLELPHRRKHQFTYERGRDMSPPLKETLVLTVEGDVAASAWRQVAPPETAGVAARAKKAPREAMQMLGYILMGLSGFGAVAVFLIKLQAGRVVLRFAVGMGVLAAGVGFVTQFMQGATLFAEWDPMMPAWVSAVRSQLAHGGQNLGILLLTVVLVAAGDALDRERGWFRGHDLHLLAAGKLFGRDMGLASWRGFLMGLICGGVMALSVTVITALFDGHVSIQPRGFFYYAINSNAAGITVLLFFFGIALFEESAYRLFGGTWFESVLGERSWGRVAAIVIPSVIYGLTHTKLTFLPPYDPFWARALVMTLVGCVWGWGFFRYGMMTVVFSHFSADLFIFNQPRLMSGDPVVVLEALAVCSAPLLPALGYGVKLVLGRLRREQDVPEFVEHGLIETA